MNISKKAKKGWEKACEYSFACGETTIKMPFTFSDRFYLSYYEVYAKSYGVGWSFWVKNIILQHMQCNHAIQK